MELLNQLKEVLYIESKKNFEDILVKYKDEEIYAIGLYTHDIEDFNYITTTVISKNTFDKALEENGCFEVYKGKKMNYTERRVKWDVEESYLHDLNEEEGFEESNQSLEEIGKVLDSLYENNRDEYNKKVVELKDLVVATLSKLNKEGIFNSLNKKETLIYFWWQGQNKEEVLNIGKKLNTLEIVETIKKEMV